MTFAKAVRQELINTFGPRWVTSAMMWVVIFLGVIAVFHIGSGVIDVANGVNVQLEGMME